MSFHHSAQTTLHPCLDFLKVSFQVCLSTEEYWPIPAILLAEKLWHGAQAKTEKLDSCLSNRESRRRRSIFPS